MKKDRLPRPSKRTSAKAPLRRSSRPDQLGPMRRELRRLQQEVYLLREAVDQLPIPVYYKDRAGRCTGCNKAFQAFTGISRDELVGKTVFDFLPPAEAQEHAEKDRALIDQGAGQVYEWHFRSRAGGARHVMFHKVPLRARGGRVVGLVSALVDLTARRRAEEALRRSEERLRLIFEHSKDGINLVEFDPRTAKRRLLLCNDRYVEMSGYTRQQLMEADDLNQLVQPYEDPHRGLEEYRNILAGVPFSGQGSWIRPDGKENHYEWTAAPVRIGQKLCILGIDRDITGRRRAEQELAESREVFSAFMDQLPGLAFIKDQDGRLRYASARAREVFAVEDCLGRGPEAYLPPELARRASANDRKALAGASVQADERLPTRDGQRRWFRTRTFPIRRQGKPPLLGEVAFDITDNRAAEDALRQARQDAHQAGRKLQRLIDGSPDIIFQIDLEGNYTFGNPAAERVTGYSLEEVLPMNMFQLVAPEYHALLADRMRRRKAGGELPQPFRFEIIRKDGARAVLELTTAPILQDDRLVGVQGVARDITEQVRAQQALEETTRKLQSIIEGSWDIIFQTDLEGNFTFVSPAAERITRYRLDEVLRMNVFQVVAPEHRAIVAERLASRKAGQDPPQPFRLEAIGKDGRRVFLELINTSIRRDGALVGVQGAARDITAQVQAEYALRAAHHQLVWAREEERRRLAAELHDSVGQELIALHMGLKGMEGEPAGDRMPQAIQRVLDLIRDVRVISHGLYPPTLESLGLASALRQLAAELGRRPPVEVTVAEDLQSLRCTAAAEIALFRICQEAIQNALRHAEAERVEVRMEEADGELVLSVSDDGVGFDPKAGAGNGLGLTTMAERAEAIGACLRVQSGRQGTRVEVRLALPAMA